MKHRFRQEVLLAMIGHFFGVIFGGWRHLYSDDGRNHFSRGIEG